MKVYVVMGRSGCYDGEEEWVVKGYLDQDRAEGKAVSLRVKMKAVQKQYEAHPVRESWSFRDEVQAIDPQMGYYDVCQGDWSYCVRTIEVEE